MDSVGQAFEDTRRQSATTKSVLECADLTVETAESMKERELSTPKTKAHFVAILAVRLPSPQPLWLIVSLAARLRDVVWISGVRRCYVHVEYHIFRLRVEELDDLCGERGDKGRVFVVGLFWD